MTHRVQRVSELIRRELCTILERNYTFGSCLVTIHEVELPADLKQGFVYVGILGTGQTPESIVKKLNASRGHIQRELYKRVVLKNSPVLTFRVTDSVERGVHLLNIINSLPEIPDDVPEDDDDEPEALPKKD
jgi:ribosome-binding factor A